MEQTTALQTAAGATSKAPQSLRKANRDTSSLAKA